MSDDRSGGGNWKNSGGGDGGDSSGSKTPFSLNRYPSVTDSLDTVFGLLRDARRRYLLYYLHAMDGTVAEYETAVDAVYEHEVAGGATDDHVSREEVRIELHHTHLPRLADAEIIDYDPRHGTVRFTGDPALEEWVEHARYKELD